VASGSVLQPCGAARGRGKKTSRFHRWPRFGPQGSSSAVCAPLQYFVHTPLPASHFTPRFTFTSPTRLLATRQRIKRRTLENRAAAERKEEQRYNVEQRGSIGNMCSYIILVILSLSLP
jgi:hypothetical protein